MTELEYTLLSFAFALIFPLFIAAFIKICFAIYKDYKGE